MKPPKLFISEMNLEMEMKLKNELEMKRRNDVEMNDGNEHTVRCGNERRNEPKMKTRLEMNENVEMNKKKED